MMNYQERMAEYVRLYREDHSTTLEANELELVRQFQAMLEDLNRLRAIWKAYPSLTTQGNYLSAREDFGGRFDEAIGHYKFVSGRKIWADGIEKVGDK